MAFGKPGADSSTLVTSKVNGKTLVQLATEHFGETPVLWGRYFKSPTATGNVEYRHKKENQILRDNNIRVLPIGRQTNHVNGTRELGRKDADNNVRDILASFGKDVLAEQGGQILLFLDVEGPPNPSLSVSFYHGWAQGVVSISNELTDGAVTVLPCVYAPRGNTTTFKNIGKAVSQEANTTCHGVWVARLFTGQTGCIPMRNFDPGFVNPTVEIPCKVLLHQFSFDCRGAFDLNQTNPEIDLQAELLSKLVLPPPEEDH